MAHIIVRTNGDEALDFEFGAVGLFETHDLAMAAAKSIIQQEFDDHWEVEVFKLVLSDLAIIDLATEDETSVVELHILETKPA